MDNADKPNIRIADNLIGSRTQIEMAGLDLYDTHRPSIVQVDTDARRRGSGFIADKHGRIVTDAHVIEGANEIFVIAQNGSRYKTGLEKLDDTGDLAVLQLLDTTRKLGPPLQFRKETTGLQPEQKVYGIGHGMGLRTPELVIGYFEKETTPFGFSTSVNPKWAGRYAQKIAWLKPEQRAEAVESLNRPALMADMESRPGDSGGPVIDADGKLIGVMQMRLRGYHAMAPAERVEAMLSEPGRFKFKHGLRAEKWTENWTHLAAERPVAAAGIAGLAAADTVIVSRLFPRIAGGGFGVHGTANLFNDVPAYFHATDSADSLKYGVACGGDLLETAGGIAMLIPRVRAIGIAAASLGFGTRLASDFVPNHYVVSEVSRLDGNNRPPFSWDRFIR
jgi:hypothetical protein